MPVDKIPNQNNFMYNLYIDTIDGEKLLKISPDPKEIESIIRDQCVGSTLILYDLNKYNWRSYVSNDITSIWRGRDLFHMRKVRHIKP